MTGGAGARQRGRLVVSRIRRALAAATMAAAAAGGGLLIAAAGAVPAYASAPSAPARGHTITITAHPKASRYRPPRDPARARKRPGTGIKPASCGDQTIVCTITASTPTVVGGSPKAVIAGGETDCTSPVDEIDMTQDLAVPGGQVLMNADDPLNDTSPGPRRGSPLPARRATTPMKMRSALITWPAGYVQTAGSNPIHQTVSRFVASSSCRSGSGGGGGGGGGGCAVHAPALATHPAGRHPDLIACP